MDEEISDKGGELTAEELKDVFSQWRFLNKEKREEIESSVDSKVRSKTYRVIVECLHDTGQINQLREDLLDPEKEIEGFEKVGEDRYHSRHLFNQKEGLSEGGFWAHPPEKRPTSINSIGHSVLDYLTCVGYGFNFDAEYIYNPQKDIKRILKAVLQLSDLDVDVLEVSEDDSREEILVKIESGEKSFEDKFIQKSDWLGSEALRCLGKAMESETGEEIWYSSGNNARILVLPEEPDDLMVSVLKSDFLNKI